MRRVTGVLLAAAVLVVLAAGCSQGGAVDVDVTSLASDLATKVTYGEELTPLDTEGAERAFRVDAADVAKAEAYVGSGATVDEVSVWEAVDDNAAQTIEQELTDRIAQRKADYADYMPEEVPKLDEAIVARSGKYVVTCVTADAAAAQDIIDKALHL